MQSLRDKLLKAGLVTEEQAQKAETTRQNDPQPRRGGDAPRRDDRPRRQGDAPRRPHGEAARPQGEVSRPQGEPAGAGTEMVIKRAPLPPRPAGEGERPPREERGFRGGPGGRGGGGGRRPGERPAAGGGGDRPIPKLPLLPGSKAAQREESRKQLEQDRKVRELVLAHQVAVDEGASVFYFMTRKKKLRRLTLTEAQAGGLERGELAIVERPDPDKIEHTLMAAEHAEQLFAIAPRAVRFFNRKDSPVGFMTDEELKAQQTREAEAEARGETGGEEDGSSQDASSQDASQDASQEGVSQDGATPGEVSAEGDGAEGGGAQDAASAPDVGPEAGGGGQPG
jgi:hypothetical protein